MAVDVPQFDLPFRFKNGKPAVVEQGSTDDVENSVEIILRYPQGFLDHSPQFGTPDQTFRMGGVDVDAMRQAVERWLGDAGRVFITEQADRFDALVRKVKVDVQGGEDG